MEPNSTSWTEQDRNEYHSQKAAFIEAAKPLIKFLQQYGNPHVTAIVNTNSAELLGSEIITPHDFLKTDPDFAPIFAGV